MLALRLARTGRPAALLCRLLVAGSAACVGFLLLAALSHALAQPHGSAGSVARLLWCLAPLAAAAQLASAVARRDPGAHARAGLRAAGLGSSGMPLLAAGTTALSCLVGSACALLAYLQLRGQLAGTPFGGAARELLAAGRPLPAAATVTLLSVAPLTAAGAAALSTRSQGERADDRRRSPIRSGSARRRTGHIRTASGADEATEQRRASAPLRALPWGLTLSAVGLALETYASRPLPAMRSVAGLAGAGPGVLGGWLIAALGLALTGPGLTLWCGRLLAFGRAGAPRLLAGRTLQEDAARLGGPLGVLCAVAAAAMALAQLHGAGRHGADSVLPGPLPVLGAAVVVSCVVASTLLAVVESKASRASTGALLARLGASRGLLRAVAVLRAGGLVVVLGPPTWAVGLLAALPLTS